MKNFANEILNWTLSAMTTAFLAGVLLHFACRWW
jgi:hypothetical protein